jgi:hypothetical protein
MKAANSSSTAVTRVDSAKIARALLDANYFEMLERLMKAEWSAQELAGVLHLPLAKTHYRLQKLEALGIAVCVRSAPRHGRSIRFYRVLQTEWFVPFEFTPASTPTELIAMSFRPTFERFFRCFGQLAERFIVPNAWGIQLSLRNQELELELSPDRPERHLTGAVCANWTVKRLSRENAHLFEIRLKELTAELADLPDEPDAPEHILGLFLIEQPESAT